MSDLRDHLLAFDRDPSRASATVLALRAVRVWWVPYADDGEIVTLLREGHRFVAVGGAASDVLGLGAPRPVPAAVLWAFAPAGRADGVVIDPRGLAPLWLDASGVERVAGLPGARLDSPMVARSVAEVHLVLDAIGWPAGARGHRLVDEGGALLAEYRWEAAHADAPALLRFRVDDPGEPHDFGSGPSKIIDPAGWRWVAERLAAAASAPARTGADRAPDAARLAMAIRCLREVLAFAPPGEEIPPDAFFTAAGRLIYELEPGRFHRPRLEAMIASWERVAATRSGVA